MPFPSNPTAGQTYTDEQDRRYYWDTKRWLGGSVRINIINEGGGGAEDMPTVLEHNSVSGAKTIDVTAAGLQIVNMVGNITLSFTGTPSSGNALRIELHLKKDNNSTQRTVTWPSLTALRWGNNAYPWTPEIQANARSVFVITTFPDGSRYAFHADNFDA